MLGRCSPIVFASFHCALLASRLIAHADDVVLQKNEQGVRATVGDKLFTEYVTKSNSRPILYPIIGPGGQKMTRDWPMVADTKEEKDHVWHRSLWFAHEQVNGVDFWTEVDPKASKPNKYPNGTIEHVEFLKVESGPVATISTRNQWLGPDGKKMAEDVRTIHLSAPSGVRVIDYDLELKATDIPLVLDDAKDSTFAFRVAHTMAVKQKLGGAIHNSAGQTDDATWGQTAEWVDYSGPAEGETVGVTMMSHPRGYGFPTRWHVRTYGLFAANPLGNNALSQGKAEKVKLQIPVGKSETFRYRIVLHSGGFSEADCQKWFEAYKNTP
jgi:hypothetical protein